MRLCHISWGSPNMHMYGTYMDMAASIYMYICTYMEAGGGADIYYRPLFQLLAVNLNPSFS